MKAGRYATSRQKACHSCSNAKAKCDLKAGTCSRCALRGLFCTYPPKASFTVPPNSTATISDTDLHAAVATSESLIIDGMPPSVTTDSSPGTHARSPDSETIPHAVAHDLVNTTVAGNKNMNFNIDQQPCMATFSRAGESAALDFTRLSLTCPIDVESIQNRWLNSYIPAPGQTIKSLPPSITAFVYRILKSYAAMAIRGHSVPPFVHVAQLSLSSLSPPLSTCLSLVRICEKPLPGSEEVAADVLQREMSMIHQKHSTYDGPSLLAAFQAYLIYSLAIYFRLNRDTDPFFRQAIMNLQEIACCCSRQGLVCSAEREGARPRWEEWVTAEAKRRTLYAMYLFDNMLSARDGLPTYVGTELRGLPAPASKFLWQARARNEWEKTYNSNLAEWAEEGLRIDELWAVPADWMTRVLLKEVIEWTGG